jgi:enoyl-[acyl-carrier protein] reductase II
MNTRITEMLGIEYPIIQGGMAWVAEHNLAAAVSEAGGLGLIGGANAPGEVVREEIKKVNTKRFVKMVFMYQQAKTIT